MVSRVVVHSNQVDADAVETITGRLRARGVQIVEEQPHMLLVSGTKATVDDALGDAHGWSVSDLTTTPLPSVRQRILKEPS